MSKKNNKAILKKKKIEVINDIKEKKPLKLQPNEIEEDILNLNRSKKELVNDKDDKEENINDDVGNDENYDDDFGDDKNEIDDEDKEIDTDEKEEEEEEEEEEDDIAINLGDDEKGDKEPMDYEDDKCVYNFVDDKSDDEIELVFDDDIIPEISDVVLPEQRKSKPLLFKYERVRLLGDRTQQLTLGAKPMIKNTENLTPKQIAELELQNNVIPLIIQRPLPNGKKERWYIKELKH